MARRIRISDSEGKLWPAHARCFMRALHRDYPELEQVSGLEELVEAVTQGARR